MGLAGARPVPDRRSCLFDAAPEWHHRARDGGAHDPDGSLVSAAIGGDRAAFGELLRRHYDRIHGLAWQMTGSRADAEDIAQDVCCALVKKAFDRAIDADPDLAIAYLNRGLAWQAKGDLRRARADLDRAVERRSSARADADARRALERDPDNKAVLP